MNCNEFTEILVEYWDLPDNDIRKVSANRHLNTCLACREEFEIWQTSADWIRFSREPEHAVDSFKPVSADVMTRIYKDESWRIPLTFRSYTLSYMVRRTIMGRFSSFMALFIVTFMNSLTAGRDIRTAFIQVTDVIDPAHAK